MNFKSLILSFMISGLFINPILAESINVNNQIITDQKRQKYLSIAKKVGAGIGIATVAISGGLGGYLYLRHRKKQLFLHFQEALDTGDIEKFKKLAPDVLASGCTDSDLLHRVLDEPRFLREGNMQKAVEFVLNQLKLQINLDKPNFNSAPPLFKVVRLISEFATQENTYTDQLLSVIDLLIERGANQNVVSQQYTGCVSIRGYRTPVQGSLLHAAATIFNENIRTKVVNHLLAKGVNPLLFDENNRTYTDIINYW